MVNIKFKRSRKRCDRPKRAVVRSSVIAGGAFATAAASLVGQMAPTAAAAATPNYAGDITSYSDALNNTLAASNTAANTLGSWWNPLAGNASGALPIFVSSDSSVDMTAISSLPSVLRSLAQTPMPTAVPGVVPQVSIPGQGFTTLPLPTSLPGGEILNAGADVLESSFYIPGVGALIENLPPLSELIPGLVGTQNTYDSGYSVPLLGISGSTAVSNTYVQTPPEIAQITAALPVGEGMYAFPLDSAAGWWAAVPTLAANFGPDDPGSLVSMPMGAAGVQAPAGLGQAGLFAVSVLLPSSSGTYVPVGATISNASIPDLGFGITNLNLTTGNYVGADGVNVNNGQNIAVIQTPLTGAIPIPIVYSLGGFNVGTEGAGYTAPSLYGVSLISPIQIGTAAQGNAPDGLIPADLIPVGAVLPTQLTSVSAVASALLGVQDPSSALEQALTPVYQGVVTPGAREASDQLAHYVNTTVDGAASLALQASKSYKDLAEKISTAVGSAPPSGSVLAEKLSAAMNLTKQADIQEAVTTSAAQLSPEGTAPMAQPVAATARTLPTSAPGRTPAMNAPKQSDKPQSVAKEKGMAAGKDSLATRMGTGGEKVKERGVLANGAVRSGTTGLNKGPGVKQSLAAASTSGAQGGNKGPAKPALGTGGATAHAGGPTAHQGTASANKPAPTAKPDRKNSVSGGSNKAHAPAGQGKSRGK